MLMTDPPCLELRMRKQTYFETNHVPFKFVLQILSHSSSVKSNGLCTLPKVIQNAEVNTFLQLLHL